MGGCGHQSGQQEAREHPSSLGALPGFPARPDSLWRSVLLCCLNIYRWKEGGRAGLVSEWRQVWRPTWRGRAVTAPGPAVSLGSPDWKLTGRSQKACERPLWRARAFSPSQSLAGLSWLEASDLFTSQRVRPSWAALHPGWLVCFEVGSLIFLPLFLDVWISELCLHVQFRVGS